jgi:hypothetical protein
MITDPSEFDFVFEFSVTEDLAADCVQSRIDDFCSFDPFALFDTCNAFGKAFDKLLCIFIGDWREDVDGWQQTIGCSG